MSLFEVWIVCEVQVSFSDYAFMIISNLDDALVIAWKDKQRTSFPGQRRHVKGVGRGSVGQAPNSA